MTAAAWLQLAALVVLIGVSARPLGAYMARVFGDERAPGDRVFRPVEGLVYRVTGVDAHREQRWSVYAASVIAFSFLSVILLYVLQRVQGSLPGNPTGMEAVSPALAWNTAVSF